MYVIKGFYADYIKPDGLVEKTKFYTEPEYFNKTFVKEVYEDRTDELIR